MVSIIITDDKLHPYAVTNVYLCVCVFVALSWPFTKNICDHYFGCTYMYRMGTVIYCMWVYNYVFLFLFEKREAGHHNVLWSVHPRSQQDEVKSRNSA